jgi:uncharacterized membrane protein YdjX (TVP38/TMEM64 family)
MKFSLKDNKSKDVWKLILFVALVISAIAIFRLMGWEDQITLLRNWIRSLGAWGPFVYIFFYILAVILALPGSAITVIGATLFGSVLGVVLVSIASTIGAGLAFLIARHVARNLILQKIGKNEKFQKLDKLTAEHGAIIVVIVRLVPLFPFNIVNYGFGLTAVPFWTYFFWSWLGMLPVTILYVVGTDAIVSGLMSGKIPWQLIIILLPTVIILAFLIHQAKKRISK